MGGNITRTKTKKIFKVRGKAVVVKLWEPGVFNNPDPEGDAMAEQATKIIWLGKDIFSLSQDWQWGIFWHEYYHVYVSPDKDMKLVQRTKERYHLEEYSADFYAAIKTSKRAVKHYIAQYWTGESHTHPSTADRLKAINQAIP